MAIAACLFVGALGLIWVSARSSDAATQAPTDVRLVALQVGLLICVMLCVGPLTSKVYFVALLWPAVAICVAAWDQAIVRRAMIGVAVVSSALPLLPGRTMQRLLLIAGTDFYVSSAILALVAFTLVRSSRSD